MSAQPQAVTEENGVSEVEQSLDVAIEVARRGYAMPVIRLAVVRKGLADDSAYVVAILAQRLARIPPDYPPPTVAAPLAVSGPVATYEDREGLAAVWALQSLSRFLFYAVLAVGGGICLGLGFGWEAGFAEGTEESVRRVTALLQEFRLP